MPHFHIKRPENSGLFACAKDAREIASDSQLIEFVQAPCLSKSETIGNKQQSFRAPCLSKSETIGYKSQCGEAFGRAVSEAIRYKQGAQRLYRPTAVVILFITEVLLLLKYPFF